MFASLFQTFETFASFEKHIIKSNVMRSVESMNLSSNARLMPCNVLCLCSAWLGADGVSAEHAVRGEDLHAVEGSQRDQRGHHAVRGQSGARHLTPTHTHIRFRLQV